MYDVDSLASALDEIKLRYEILGVVSPSKDDVNTSKPKPGSKPPASLHLTALTDPRSVWRKPGDVMSVPGTLHSWYWSVAARLCITVDGKPMHSVDYYCSWLTAFLDRCPQDLLDDLGHDIMELRNQLRSATGEPGPKPFGYCQCGNPLYYVGESDILCNLCGIMYDTYRMVEHLAHEQGGQTLVTRATLSAWFGRSEHTIRAKCNVVEYDDNGRALYDVHEAKRVLDATASRLKT